jgi:hypothetical protein
MKLSVVAIAALWSSHLWAFGAVAVGQQESAANGVAVGASWNAPSEDAARVHALQQCLDSKVTPMASRALCKVVHTFTRRCVSIVADQRPGGTGWGWAVEPDLAVAERRALALCNARTCASTVAACDSTP